MYFNILNLYVTKYAVIGYKHFKNCEVLTFILSQVCGIRIQRPA